MTPGPARPSREEIVRQDIRDLERLGYTQQLFREMGGFSNFAISFSIISVLTGAVLLYGYGLKFAGPIVNSVGWPLVSVLTLCVAASMAELASAYPTAGGLYFWAFRLGGRTWAWTTAWLNMIGQVTITAGINDLSVWWHIGGVLLIAVLLAAFGRHHNPLGFLFQAGPAVGYDASAHVAEETTMARLNAAWGIFLSVAVSAVVGYVMLLIFTWCIPGGDVAKTANDAYPVLYIVYGNLATVWAHVVAIVIGGAMWLCGLASITSMGRMWYAFARDDGMPGARVLKRIHATTGTPVAATLVTSALAVLMCLYAAAYSVVTSISTIALYLAYGIPIWLNFRNRRRGRGEFVTGEQAPWNLGRWAPLINAVAIAWIVVLTVVFVLPPNELVLWTMLVTAAGLAAYWRFGARRHFRGPKRA